MNAVIVIGWWVRTAVVFFTDIDGFYVLAIGKDRTLRGARSYIRREVFGKYGVALSCMRLVKDTPPVSFLLVNRIEKEV